jgi:transcriptional regulator with PAS, ATPase and Fis domain
VRVNCPAIPFELAESELFGYEKGAFTGASSHGKLGSFETANGGTVFLDEISSLPLSIQAKLLRVLQEKEIGRLGSTKTKKIDFRLIAATNTDLKRLIKEGKFRDDLYYRVAKALVNVPPIRERPEDIPLYLTYFLQKTNQSFKTHLKGISSSALNLLCEYDWPGNVRELINVLEQAAIRAWNVAQLEVEHLPAEILQSPRRGGNGNAAGARGGIRHEMMQREKELVADALKQTNGNKRKAALILKMARSTLYKKIENHGLEHSD